MFPLMRKEIKSRPRYVDRIETPSDLRAALEYCGLKLKDLGALCEVAKNAPSGWATGRTKIPGGVKRYLELRMALKRLAEKSV